MPTHKPAGNANQPPTVIDRHRNSRRHVCRIGFLPGGRSLEQQNLIGSSGDGCPLSTHIDVFIFIKGEANLLKLEHVHSLSWGLLEGNLFIFGFRCSYTVICDLKGVLEQEKRIRCLSVDSLVISSQWSIGGDLQEGSLCFFMASFAESLLQQIKHL